ncbi:TraR/DksA C4-type zinc finger protein [Duganella sp. FT3S]|uniref:TraR/DksA C4-type zinc finger protein n=1 Tax=Rugamonas fusca TaxID=2758568 RepID=A0A7W2EH52_9BURK|nr:TraR/DksA C4-type zinc finger protein [Rugamonas fusca]MBA5605850.1 TraR/DksA C4-type zinc finger protein [Rugamonas fusca]
MTDECEQASKREELDREVAIRRQRLKTIALACRAGVEYDCRDCGIAIPADRRQAAPGCTRCRPCEMAAEAQRKLMRQP